MRTLLCIEQVSNWNERLSELVLLLMITKVGIGESFINLFFFNLHRGTSV